jgi:hypothetical protein
MGWSGVEGEERCVTYLPKKDVFSISIPLSANSFPISIGMTSNMLSRPGRDIIPLSKNEFFCPSWMIDRVTTHNLQNFMIYPLQKLFSRRILQRFCTRNFEIRRCEEKNENRIRFSFSRSGRNPEKKIIMDIYNQSKSPRFDLALVLS